LLNEDSEEEIKPRSSSRKMKDETAGDDRAPERTKVDKMKRKKSKRSSSLKNDEDYDSNESNESKEVKKNKKKDKKSSDTGHKKHHSASRSPSRGKLKKKNSHKTTKDQSDEMEVHIH
jgi:hypothetical protein